MLIDLKPAPRQTYGKGDIVWTLFTWTLVFIGVACAYYIWASVFDFLVCSLPKGQVSRHQPSAHIPLSAIHPLGGHARRDIQFIERGYRGGHLNLGAGP